MGIGVGEDLAEKRKTPLQGGFPPIGPPELNERDFKASQVNTPIKGLERPNLVHQAPQRLVSGERENVFTGPY